MGQLEREFELVASLNPAEKRFVKLVGHAVAGREGSKMLQLFDILNRMKTYDRECCETHVKLRAMRSSLPTIARRLRKLVFKCIQQLESDRSPSGRLSLLLHEVEFSFLRQRSQDAARLARAGLKLALFYGRYELALAFIDWQRRILQVTFLPGTAKQFRKLQQNTQHVLALLHQQQS